MQTDKNGHSWLYDILANFLKTTLHYIRVT